ncbi:hypothetical protein [Terasakiella pusilla]|uniref:hypothetical protein n=1 Tax=Terasakiella pusilla TaxID=64973 RepID=UPI003AA7B662
MKRSHFAEAMIKVLPQDTHLQEKYFDAGFYEALIADVRKNKKGSYEAAGPLSTSEYLMVMLGADTQKAIGQIKDMGRTQMDAWRRLNSYQHAIVYEMWLRS